MTINQDNAHLFGSSRSATLHKCYTIISDSIKKVMDTSTRYLSFVGGLEFDSIQPLLYAFDEIRNDDGVKGVELSLTSTGGWFFSAFAVYDYLKTYPKPVDIIASGCCHSTALLILQAGATRLSRRHTNFELHRVVHGAQDKTLADIKTSVEGFKRQEDTYFTVLAERAAVDEKSIRSLCEAERSFDAAEALTLA